jgi:hypothetical protein
MSSRSAETSQHSHDGTPSFHVARPRTSPYAPVLPVDEEYHSCDAFRTLDPIGFKLFGYDLGALTMEAMRNVPWVNMLFDMFWRIGRLTKEHPIAIELEHTLHQKRTTYRGRDRTILTDLETDIKKWNDIKDTLSGWELLLRKMKCLFVDCGDKGDKAGFSARDKKKLRQIEEAEGAPTITRTLGGLKRWLQFLWKKVNDTGAPVVGHFFFTGGSFELSMLQHMRAAEALLGRNVVSFTPDLFCAIDGKNEKRDRLTGECDGDGLITGKEMKTYILDVVAKNKAYIQDVRAKNK